MKRPLGLITFASLLALGCDASVEVRGRVYRWVDPPASVRGQILIDAPRFHVPSKAEPLAGAKVTLFYSEDGARRLDPAERYWRDWETTAADGGFEADGACAGGSYEMAVTVEREGCLPLAQRFFYRDDHPDHEAVVLLVCPGPK